MKKLETDFDFRGFRYHQEWRNDEYAIYSQFLKESFCGYESIRIGKNKAGERFGKEFGETESYPPDKQWGINGFTSKTFEEAKKMLFNHFGKIQNLLLPNDELATFSLGLDLDTPKSRKGLK